MGHPRGFWGEVRHTLVGAVSLVVMLTAAGAVYEGGKALLRWLLRALP